MEEFENQNFEEELPYEDEQPRRSTTLLVLCILTFIGSGFGALGMFCMPTMARMFPMMEPTYAQMGMSQYYEQLLPMYEYYTTVGSWKFVLAGLTYVLAVVGAAFMLKMNKLGFHLYTIAQILGFCCLHFLIGGYAKVNVSSALWTIMFVVLYYVQMRSVLKKRG